MVLDRDFLVHAAAGTVGGVAGVYVGAPLDTVKVLVQTRDYGGVLDCVRTTVRSQGPRALYKGALTSALGQVPNNAIVFGSYGSTLAWLARTFPSSSSSSSSSSAAAGGGGSILHVFLAGCWAGFLQCLALAPLEHIKCQQQAVDWRPGVKHMSTLECGRGLFRAKGLGGLYRGFWSLVLRDAPTYGLYFAVYEVLQKGLAPPGSTDAPVYATLLAGGLAGMAAWAAATPFDVLKSTIQCSPIATPAAQNRISVVAAWLFKAEGVRGFFRGLGTSLVRAFPVNAVTFVVYDSLLSNLAPQFHHEHEEAPRK